MLPCMLMTYIIAYAMLEVRRIHLPAHSHKDSLLLLDRSSLRRGGSVCALPPSSDHTGTASNAMESSTL